MIGTGRMFFYFLASTIWRESIVSVKKFEDFQIPVILGVWKNERKSCVIRIESKQ